MPIVADDVNTPAKFAEMIEEIKAGIVEVLTDALIPVAYTVTVVAGGGSYTLAGSGSIASNATAANLQSILETLFGAGLAVVTGAAGGPYAVTLANSLRTTPLTVVDSTTGAGHSVTATLGVVGEKVPLLKNRLIVDPIPDKFAARLRSKRHIEGTGSDTVEKVHAFMVGYGGIDLRNPDNTVGRQGYRLRFLIDSYYEDDIGTDADNAEKRHNNEAMRAMYALFASRVLKRPGVVKRVDDFQERRGFTAMGSTVVRKSLGELYVFTKAVPLPHSP